MIIDKNYREKILALVDKFKALKGWTSDEYVGLQTIGNPSTIKQLRTGGDCLCGVALRLELALINSMPKEKK